MADIPKIYLNPGHSNTDPGAVGYVQERSQNVKVTKYQNEYLLANYICETKVTAGTLSLSAAIKEANNWGADFVCSNHFNAGGGNGWEGLVYSEASREIGEVFEKYVKAIGQNSRGVKIRPDLGILRLTNAPAILTESAFVDNKQDIKDWDEDHELKQLGIAYAKATAEVVGLKKKTGTDVVKKPTSKQPKKSTATIAKEVLAGKWGNGAERKKRLTEAGYEYAVIQRMVSALKKQSEAKASTKKSIATIANEVIAGKWGNGDTRKKKLTAAGYDAAAVQKKVNEILSKKKKK